MRVLAKSLTAIPGTTDVAGRIQALDWDCILAVVPLRQGDAVTFAVCHRSVQGTRGGVYRVHLRYGVSRIRNEHRHALGLIFHDAL